MLETVCDLLAEVRMLLATLRNRLPTRRGRSAGIIHDHATVWSPLQVKAPLVGVAVGLDRGTGWRWVCGCVGKATARRRGNMVEFAAQRSAAGRGRGQRVRQARGRSHSLGLRRIVLLRRSGARRRHLQEEHHT